MSKNTRTKRTQRFYADICKDYNKLSEIKKYGVQKFNEAYIIRLLAEKYYRSPATIENIIYGRTAYPKSQLEL